MTDPRSLQRLAETHGVQPTYQDNSGEQRNASEEALRAVLHALGARADHEHHGQPQRLIEPVMVAWNGLPVRVMARTAERTPIRYELYLEDGAVRNGSAEAAVELNNGRSQYPIPGELPFGYHELVIESAGERARALVISAPDRAWPDDRSARMSKLGVFLPLHALRSAKTVGVGDFGALTQLRDWSTELGISFISTLPLLASFLDEPFEPSPYSPVSRLFWNELFLDLQRALELLPCEQARLVANHPEFSAAAGRLSAPDLVDYRGAAVLKRRVLQPLTRCFFDAGGDRHPAWRDFLTLYPRAEDYAQFRATTERQRRGWPAWPQRQRDGVLQPADYDAESARYHLFAQFLAHLQLKELANPAKARLYLDLPLGVNGAGYDVWRERQLFATGVSAGAPPDAFFTHGQNWGFPPLNPTALREDGYRYLREVIRTHLRYAGALRLDHVMALHRLFWVPGGMKATDGVYVQYPADELFAVLCLEAQRHQALVVGEDLGTVPPEVRQQMERHHVLRMYVVQFEAHSDPDKPLSNPPADSVASLNTHDMPTFAAYRTGRDADLRRELNLISAAEATAVHQARTELLAAIAGQLQRARFLHHPAEPGELRDALLDFLAGSSAALVLINLEDLWDEERPQNVPGTAAERPNWRRKARLSLEQIISSPEINAALRRLNQKRREN